MKILLSLATSALLATTAWAQAAPEGVRISATGPPVYATLDLDTGVTRILDAPAAAHGRSVCFDNSIDTDMVRDALLYYAGDELFDWGIKGCSGSGFIESITIGYSSMAPQPTGGELILRIYERAFGFGLPGTEAASLHLTGLMSWPGPAVSPIYLTIDLGAQAFYLPDGPIGWSYENQDDLTAPLLVDVDPSLGTQNFFDVYRPGPASAGNFLGTFTLPPGGGSNDPLENSFFLQLHQNDTPASSTPIAGAGNPDILSAPAPIVGAPWPLWVDLTSYPGATLTAAMLTSQRIPGIATQYGELLLDLSTDIAPISVSTWGLHVVHIPLDVQNVGVQFYAQGGFFAPGSGFQLTNALELVAGTQ